MSGRKWKTCGIPSDSPTFLSTVTHTEACLAINMIPKVGPVRLRRLLAVFDDPPSILRAPVDRLAAVEGISREIARNIAGWESLVDLPAERARMEEIGIQALTAQSEAYPSLLRTIHDPPIVLYVWGELKPTDSRAIGVVGSRQSSYYGQETAKKLSYQLAYAGLTVISGLARGIDTAAHQGALAAKGRTVAVLGCGLSQIYPPENLTLAERIADGSGAVDFRVSHVRHPRPHDLPHAQPDHQRLQPGGAGGGSRPEKRRAHQRRPGRRTGPHGLSRCPAPLTAPARKGQIVSSNRARSSSWTAPTSSRKS